MRSFFKKPSWASRGDEGTDPNFYRHAGQVYNDIITANREARANRLSIMHAPEHEPEHKNSKRRRLSCGQPPAESSSGGLPHDEVPRNVETPLNSNASYKHLQETNNNENNNDNSCGPSAGLSSCGITAGTATETGVQCCESPPDVELIHGGTTGAQSEVTKAVDENKIASVKESHYQNAREVDETVTPHNHSLAHNQAIVQILITSKIPNTKPLIVRRKMNQPLKDVRLAWCNRQKFTKEMQDSVFLTWKGKRLFDVTTCRSLGIHAKSGYLNEYDTFQLDVEDIQVHMEASTEDILSADLYESQTVTDTKSSPEYTCWGGATSSPDMIILKCPGFSDLKVKLNMEMQVSELVATFRAARQIPATRDIQLVFDGDRLEYKAYLADYELMNSDLVEVMIK
ncbi:hypothetical protein ASPNIDRAFT_188103 [Aspergillus niger ATCC 1015]|uniref:Ubiquitin-like domain-containing protein n=2 Tax=Aspergillus niger TaxID=5061 RepID=G3YEN8_ASPNA|nr:hypothetical protein ASPNIDRAFT_188103 [Aspergillus niger ATCC 1015]